MMRDKCKNSMKIPELFYNKCFSCEKSDHYFDECRLLHYVPKRINLCQRLMYSENQERFFMERRIKKFSRVFFKNPEKLKEGIHFKINLSSNDSSNESEIFESKVIEVYNKNNNLRNSQQQKTIKATTIIEPQNQRKKTINTKLIEKKQEIFETVKNYDDYFPHSNVEQFIYKFNNLNLRKKRRVKRQSSLNNLFKSEKSKFLLKKRQGNIFSNIDFFNYSKKKLDKNMKKNVFYKAMRFISNFLFKQKIRRTKSLSEKVSKIRFTDKTKTYLN